MPVGVVKDLKFYWNDEAVELVCSPAFIRAFITHDYIAKATRNEKAVWMLLDWMVATVYNLLPKYANMGGPDLVVDFTVLLPEEETDKKILATTCDYKFCARDVRSELPELGRNE